MLNNKVMIIGTIMHIKPTHTEKGEQFYSAEIVTMRSSGTLDFIVLNMPAFIREQIEDGKKYKVEGELRSRNLVMFNQQKVLHNVFVQCIEETFMDDCSTIELNCRLVSKRNPRKTENGKDVITTTIAVDRDYGKVDFLPCTFWNRNAMRLSMVSNGTPMLIKGKLEGKHYFQRFEDDVICDFITHNIVATNFILLEED